MNQKGMVEIQMCQPELLFHEIFHLREPLVGSLVLFHYGIEERPVKKHTLYIVIYVMETLFDGLMAGFMSRS